MLARIKESLQGLTTRQANLYRREDGSVISDLEIPTTLLGAEKPFATATMRRSISLIDPWQIDERSVTIIES